MSDLTLKAVRWQHGRYNGHTGRIGHAVIGEVVWKVTREQKDWQAMSVLTHQRAEFDDLDEAKRWVESRALAFVESLVARPTSPGGTET